MKRLMSGAVTATALAAIPVVVIGQNAVIGGGCADWWTWSILCLMDAAKRLFFVA